MSRLRSSTARDRSSSPGQRLTSIRRGCPRTRPSRRAASRRAGPGSLSCWPRRRGTAKKRAVALRQRGHVAPELLELRHREDVLLAVAPALLHVLERDVGRHARGQRADGRRRPAPSSARSARVRPKTPSSWSMSIQSGQRVVVRQARTPSPRAAAPGLRPGAAGRRRAPGRRRGLRSGARSPRSVRHAPRLDVQPEQRRVDVRAERVDVVQQQVLQLRPLGAAAARARRCAAGSAPRTSGRPGAGTARAGCRCSRCPRRPASAQPISAACRLSRTFCACSSSSCCGISSQAKRRSRTIGIRRRPIARPGESSSGPG